MVFAVSTARYKMRFFSENKTYSRMSTTITGTGFVTGVASIMSILGAVYGFINHKRIRAQCCGRTLSASIDIDDKVTEKISSEPVIVHPRRASTHERRVSVVERRNSVEGRKELTTPSAQY